MKSNNAFEDGHSQALRSLVRAVDGVIVPVWASGIAFVVAAGLALMVWKETRK